VVLLNEIRLEPGDWDAAVADADGAQIIVAGPGTGKTEFLIDRVCHVVESGRARREQIALLTFSRRAAGDVRRRVEAALDRGGMPIAASTFHSLALRLLEAAPESERPIPLTTPEQIALVGRLLAEEDSESWPVLYRGILGTPAFAAEVADFLMRCSERLLSPKDLEEKAAERADWRGLPGLFRRYRERLAETGRTDYATLLVSATHLSGRPEGQELAARFRYVLVDEYQDTSPVQAELARLLALPHGNLTVAGDPYQSIYSFRGAEVRNIAAFSEEHPGARRIILGRSLRVPAEILDSALRIVSAGDLPGAAGRVEPAAHTGRVETYVFDQETAEADWIARDIEHQIRVEGRSPSTIAVLVRSKRELLNELSRALTRRNVPHDPPETRLVEHPAVRMIQDLVTVARHGGPITPYTSGEAADADRAMRRVLLGPLVGASLGREREIVRARRRTFAPWPEVLSRELPRHTGLVALLDDPSWALSVSAVDGFWHLWTHIDELERVVLDPERSDWRLAFTSFSQVLERQAERDAAVTLEDVFAFAEEEGIESVPLLPYRPTKQQVTLTTLHQAKGLEFEVVYIANAVEGVFPDLRRGRRMLRPELLSPERTTNPEAQHLFQIQEEMRLAYTAMTRARSKVVWTATSAGVDQGESRPSRFLLAAGEPGTVPRAPVEVDAPPLSLSDAEIALRRSLLDPGAPVHERLAAAELLAHPPKPWWDPMVFAGVPAPGPDQPIIGDGLRLSPSQADSYITCPRRYALERRLRLSDTFSPYAELGTLVHAALERAEKEVVGTGRSHADLDDALRHLDEVWQEADFGTPQLDAAWLRHARDAITHLYSLWPGEGEPIALEKQVQAVIGGVQWVGVIDRLDRGPNGLRVVDYKTSKHPPRVPDAKKSVQLAFYTAAVEEETGEEVVSAEMWFPRVEAKSVTRRSLDMDALPEVMEIMEAVSEAILAETWEPRVNDLCRRCDFRLSCPAWAEGKGAYLP
jgi:superfamily I DNA/RNA helicase/RecB family exonuclease